MKRTWKYLALILTVLLIATGVTVSVFGSQGSIFTSRVASEGGDVQIITDTETGIEYICLGTPFGVAITPRLNEYGGIYGSKEKPKEVMDVNVVNQITQGDTSTGMSIQFKEKGK